MHKNVTALISGIGRSREELIVPTPLPKRLVDEFAVLVWTARRGDIIQTLTLQAALEGINR